MSVGMRLTGTRNFERPDNLMNLIEAYAVLKIRITKKMTVYCDGVLVS